MGPYSHVFHTLVCQLMEEYPVSKTLYILHRKTKETTDTQQLKHKKIMFMVFYFSEVIDKPSLINRYNGRFELLVPKHMTSKKTPEEYQEDVRRIKKFYFGDEIISKQNLERYVAVSFY
jgi:hypothetical protein